MVEKVIDEDKTFTNRSENTDISRSRTETTKDLRCDGEERLIDLQFSRNPR